jgi:hypothetical protein
MPTPYEHGIPPIPYGLRGPNPRMQRTRSGGASPAYTGR